MRYRTDDFARLSVLIITIILGLMTTVPAEAPLPSAEELLDRYVEATGGPATYATIMNRRVKATLELPAQGITGSLTIWSAKPDRFYSIVEADAFGKIERGTDGNVVWEKNLMTGAVIKQGQEKIDMLRDSRLDRWTNWREVFRSAEPTGTATVGAKLCDKVSMIPAEGHPQTLYFERDTGLLVRVDQTIESQAGTLNVESALLDYREVDGIRLPFEVRVRVMGQERVITTLSVEHNVDMPDRFALPEEVEALLAMQPR
jgi:hypothetical protein